jgi:hypothetical protein
LRQDELIGDKPPVVKKLWPWLWEAGKHFPTLHGTRRFIIVLSRARHWSLSWARWIQPKPSHPIPLRSLLILFTHRSLGLPGSPFPSEFPIKTLYERLFLAFCRPVVSYPNRIHEAESLRSQ